MATKPDNSSTKRLNEIISYRRSQGGSITGSIAGGIKERLKEKFDPRQLINQKGLLTALFPGLKTYQSKTAASELTSSSLQSTSFNEIKPILETISFNTRMTAKNSMVLPALHRDVNVIRQNIVKMVKMKGGDARTKSDMYFMKAKEREDKYERELKKENSKKSKLEKLENEEKEKNKGILAKVFTAILNGLNLIVKAILNLGKAIIGAFKFIAGILFDIISSVGEFLLEVILGFNLGDKLKQFFKNFFTSKWLKAIFRGLLSLILSPRAVSALARKLFFPLGVAYFGKKFVQSIMKVRYQESGLTLEEERATIREENKEQQFPLSRITGSDLDYYREMGLMGINKNTIDVPATTQSPYKIGQTEKVELPGFFDKNILYEYGEGKRSPYKIKVPGIRESQISLLTKKEATEWGDTERKYSSIIDELIKIKNMKENERVDQNKFNRLIDEYEVNRKKLLNLAEKFAKEQLNPEKQKLILDAIKDSREKREDTVPELMLKSVAEDIMEIVEPGFEEAKKFIFSKEDDEEVQGLFDIFNLKDLKSNVSGYANRGITDLEFIMERRKKEFGEFLERQSIENNNIRDISTEPIIINENNDNNSTSTTESLPPSSAWNVDFLESYFLTSTDKFSKNIFG